VSDYTITIGLEVHVHLLTKTKMFCGCSTEFGGEPNSQVCPVCLGLPGVLPVANKTAFEFALKTAIALNCEITPFTKFDRKNYYYPDLPKNYQISQYDLPFSHDGHLEIETENGPKKVGIIRVHLEEDAGKLLHTGAGGQSLVDLNRTGTPLLEIVSKPDINSPREAYLYLTELKLLLRYIKVSDCNMQEGSLRCDANISLKVPRDGEVVQTPQVEVKNMNSFKAVEAALAFEAQRLFKEFQKTGKTSKDVPKSTRAWDEDAGKTFLMRQKEEAFDYRYFPEPDLAPIEISHDWLEKIKETIPELPAERRAKFMRPTEEGGYGSSPYEAGVLIQDDSIADYFEATVQLGADPKLASNWVMGDVMRELNEQKVSIAEFPIREDRLAQLLKLVAAKKINTTAAKEIFLEMLKSRKTPDELVKEKGLLQISDQSELEEVVDRIIAENPKPVEDFKKGKKAARGFIVGLVMKETRGKANPKVVNQILSEKLS
jgi:aspartyl-tRNA(Asn)/glutamyl-tRNA(Gln) amidotransferase subunit B